MNKRVFTNHQENIKNSQVQPSNPLTAEASVANKTDLNNYTKAFAKPNYDADVAEIVEIVRILNNMAPIRMPEYNFNIDEINGDRYYKPDGNLLLVREYDSDVIRDYYYGVGNNSEYTVSRILEHDRVSGRLRAKVEPIVRKCSNLKTSVAIFDEKVSCKYTIIQLADGGVVSNISVFSGKGKSFQTLFRNIETFKPVRYLEGKETPSGFMMRDCLFDEEGHVVRLKSYTGKNEVSINYTNNQKIVKVKKV